MGRSSCSWLLGTDAKNRKSRSRQVIPEMRVDRPFLFLVFDNTSGLVLCGAVVNSIRGS
jgi:serine protease inhibitor